jgi:methyltransferase (TIGR00027 family)
VALRRAAHQILDNPKLLDDPLAVRIIGEAEKEIHAERARYQSRIGKHFRAFIVVRSRCAEDQLSAAVAGGVEKYVVLGAGLDTSAYRNVAGPHVRVFEVDHPNTQSLEERMLAGCFDLYS